MAAKRRTPVDGGEQVLKEWQAFHREYTELGLSNHQIHKQVAARYNCSFECVRYWLRPDVRRSKTELKKRTYIPYSKSPRQEAKRIHSRIYTDLRRHPGDFLKEVYCGRDLTLSLDEITDCLHKLIGIEVRNKTLLKIVAQFEHKYGKKILVQDRYLRPPQYRFVNGP